MTKNDAKQQAGLDAAKLQKLAQSTVSATELARLVADLSVPPKVLQEIRANLSKYNETVKSLGSISDFTKTLSELSLPRVDLHLPNVPNAIRASLPRALTGTDFSSTEERRTEDRALSGGANRSTNSQSPVSEILSPADLGTLIRRAREAKQLSQQDFADLAGVGRRFVSELENGKTTLEFGKVLKAARAAGISVFADERSPQ